VRGEAFSLEQRRKGVDVALLVAVLVTLCKAVAGRDSEGVVVGDVGDDTTDTAGRASCLVDFGVEFRGGRNVRLPS
jgi:hypothetical protein